VCEWCLIEVEEVPLTVTGAGGTDGSGESVEEIKATGHFKVITTPLIAGCRRGNPD